MIRTTVVSPNRCHLCQQIERQVALLDSSQELLQAFERRLLLHPNINLIFHTTMQQNFVARVARQKRQLFELEYDLENNREQFESGAFRVRGLEGWKWEREEIRPLGIEARQLRLLREECSHVMAMNEND
jgi:hypothetical protein